MSEAEMPEVQELAADKSVKESPPAPAPLPPPDPAELLARVNAIGDSLRVLIVETKRAPRIEGLEAHQDQTRSLAQAQAALQTGFMWLRRSIEGPKVF